MAGTDSTTLTSEEIVASAQPAPRALCGVYFLINDCEVVYVGQSVCIQRRISEHLLNGVEFDSLNFIEVERQSLHRVERRYIHQLQPRLNAEYKRQGELTAPQHTRLVPRQRSKDARECECGCGAQFERAIVGGQEKRFSSDKCRNRYWRDARVTALALAKTRSKRGLSDAGL
jgi:hypothetical protein